MASHSRCKSTLRNLRGLSRVLHCEMLRLCLFLHCECFSALSLLAAEPHTHTHTPTHTPPHTHTHTHSLHSCKSNRASSTRLCISRMPHAQLSCIGLAKTIHTNVYTVHIQYFSRGISLHTVGHTRCTFTIYGAGHPSYAQVSCMKPPASVPFHFVS